MGRLGDLKLCAPFIIARIVPAIRAQFGLLSVRPRGVICNTQVVELDKHAQHTREKPHALTQIRVLGDKVASTEFARSRCCRDARRYDGGMVVRAAIVRVLVWRFARGVRMSLGGGGGGSWAGAN